MTLRILSYLIVLISVFSSAGSILATPELQGPQSPAPVLSAAEAPPARAGATPRLLVEPAVLPASNADAAPAADANIAALQAQAASVSASYGPACTLTSAGGVQCWRSRTYGQLRDSLSSAVPSISKLDAVGGLETADSMVAGTATGSAHPSLVRPTTQQCTTWNLASDFRRYPNQENPGRDTCGNLNVWHYLQGSGLNHDPATYSLMTRYLPNYGIWGIEVWQGDIPDPYSPGNYAPVAAINATGATQVFAGFAWPPDVLEVHPAPAQLAVVGWRSPLDATVSVTGTIRDLDANCGDGVLWYIDKGSSNLASGSLANGGSQGFRDGTGGGSLASIVVSQGEFLYFVVHPNGYWNCDSTQLDVSIAVTGSYSVSGRIADASNSGIADATVSAGTAGSTTTDTNGNFTLSGVPPGTYTLTPSKSGYTFSPASRTVTVPPDATGQDFVGIPETSSAGHALQFDGSDDFVSITDTGSFDFDYAFTVEAWVKPLSLAYQGTTKGIVEGALSEPPFSGHGWIMSPNISDYSAWVLSVCVPGCSYAGSASGNLQVGQWQHLAGTYDGTNISIYRNGIMLASTPWTGNVYDVNYVLLGIWSTSFNGLIDEVRIWNIARTQAQIQASMNRYLSGSEPGLVGYWHFNEGAGQAAFDSTPYLNDGRLGSSSSNDSCDPTWVASDVPVSRGTPSLVYTGAQFLTPAEVIDETDARISTGDHVHLSLPFTNNGNTPIANATIEVLGAPHSGSAAGTEIYDGSAWRINPESASLSLGTINPGETRWLDFWIYVVDSDPTLRQSLSGQTWIDIQSLTGSWRIWINLSPISFSDTVIGNDDMEAGSCLHTPQNPSIQQYAQYAAGACVKDDRTSVTEVCKPRSAPADCDADAPQCNPDDPECDPNAPCDPDTPAQAVRNLVDRVNAEFSYKSDRYSRRTIDVRLLQNRDGDIGECRDYADLTTGLLRSLNLPARTITAYLKYDKAYEQQSGKKGGAGHAWSEAFLGSSETPAWKQADSTSTWNKAIDQQSAYEDAFAFSKVQEAWADKKPLSSASPWVAKEYRCIAPCYQSPVDCAKCQQESNADKSWSFIPDLSCVDNVQSVYHNAGLAAAHTPWTTGELLVNLDSPTSVTNGVPFAISTGVTNDTFSALDVITTTIAVHKYVDSTEQLFEVAPAYQVLNNVGAGETITVTWTVTPLVTGSGIPLRFSAESGDLFEFTERPLVVNEPSTLPDLSLAGVCGLGNASPGQAVTLTASVLDEELQVFADPATVITATVVATPTLQFFTTVTLPYCASCEAYQGSLTLPTTAPIGDYVVDFEAAHPNYDPAHATSGFFVIPPLTVTLSTDQSAVGVLDTITVTAQVADRAATVTGAAVVAEIITPGGTVTVPLSFDSTDSTYKLALHPADLAGNLGGEVLPGAWQVQASGNYMGGIGTDDAAFTVVGTYPLSEVVISKLETGAKLTWPHMGSGVHHYEIYRSTSPYFSPGGADSVRLSPDVGPAPAAGDELSFTDADAFAEPGTGYFYVVQPVDANGQFYPRSNRVGVFNFALIPGTAQ